MRVRGATPPARNTFSNANRTRDPALAETLYWQMLAIGRASAPGFTQYGKHAGFIFRLKREIFALDSTTLPLTLASIDWARHRRRKAAAKCHVRLNTGTFLPTYAVVEDAAHHDSVRAATLCASLVTGDVLLGDRAYVDLAFLNELNSRGVSLCCAPRPTCSFAPSRNCRAVARILRDVLVRPAGVTTATDYPGVLRMVTALVEVDGVERELTFITNNTQWSARTIAELYRALWTIEVFFKEIKQTLPLRDFVGTNEKVKWQVWTGLLMHLLLRFLRHISRWGHSSSRCVGIVRTASTDLGELLRCYGTAGGPHRPVPVIAESKLNIRTSATDRRALDFPCVCQAIPRPWPAYGMPVF